MWKHVFGRAPSLHQRYLASSLLRTPPTPDQAGQRLCIPVARRPPSPARASTRSGLPGSSADLSMPAVLNHPGEPGRCTCSYLRDRHRLQRIRASGHSQLRHEAESGSLTLRLTPSPHEASFDGSLRQTLVWLRGARACTTVSTFQLTRSARLRLAHRIGANTRHSRRFA